MAALAPRSLLQIERKQRQGTRLRELVLVPLLAERLPGLPAHGSAAESVRGWEIQRIQTDKLLRSGIDVFGAFFKRIIRADDLEIRTVFNYPTTQFCQVFLRASFGVLHCRACDAKHSRQLRLLFPGFFTKAFGQGGQLGLAIHFGSRHRLFFTKMLARKPYFSLESGLGFGYEIVL